jgi:MFS family permease
MHTAHATPGARGPWIVTLAAAAILMVTMGARQSLGLFVSPLNTATGAGIVTVSLALALAQLVWGAVQPVAGAVADRYGPGKVLVVGLVVLAIGMASTPFMTSGFGLIVSLGLVSAIGAGASSFSVLIGAAAQRLPADKRGQAAGVINAGGSFGQFVFAPVTRGLMQALGWMGAMWSIAAATLAALPLVRIAGPAAPAPPKRARLPPRPGRRYAPRCPTAAICSCMPASSPAAFTSRSSSHTCRAK